MQNCFRIHYGLGISLEPRVWLVPFRLLIMSLQVTHCLAKSAGRSSPLPPRFY